MIVVARLDKAVIGQSIAFAIGHELTVAAKYLRLVLQEIHNLHRGALLVVIINLGGVPRLHHALINALDRVLNVKESHVHVAEGSSVVRERSVANGRSGNRGKPSVKDGI